VAHSAPSLNQRDLNAVGHNLLKRGLQVGDDCPLLVGAVKKGLLPAEKRALADIVTISTHTLEGSKPGPHLLVTGGVHGDEFEPMLAIRRLMHTIDSVHLSGRVTLAPVVNESAFARGRRTGDDDLDLARTCPGHPDGSITERTAHALTQLIRAADLYIDLHTGGAAMEILPMAGYTLHPDAAILETQRRMAMAFNLPVVWGTTPELEGRSLSVARDAGVPAIYAEYGGPPPCNLAAVENYVAGCLNVMGAIGMIDRPTPPSRVEHVVEDPRPESGHMQRCNLSPADGFFEPTVKLGETVTTGEPLGWLVPDPLGKNRVPIRSAQTGIVLVLRVFSSVRKGDALAVILELDREQQ
jgi:predicted deacylase